MENKYQKLVKKFIDNHIARPDSGIQLWLLDFAEWLDSQEKPKEDFASKVTVRIVPKPTLEPIEKLEPEDMEFDRRVRDKINEMLDRINILTERVK